MRSAAKSAENRLPEYLLDQMATGGCCTSPIEAARIAGRIPRRLRSCWKRKTLNSGISRRTLLRWRQTICMTQQRLTKHRKSGVKQIKHRILHQTNTPSTDAIGAIKTSIRKKGIGLPQNFQEGVCGLTTHRRLAASQLSAPGTI